MVGYVMPWAAVPQGALAIGGSAAGIYGHVDEAAGMSLAECKEDIGGRSAAMAGRRPAASCAVCINARKSRAQYPRCGACPAA